MLNQRIHTIQHDFLIVLSSGDIQIVLSGDPLYILLGKTTVLLLFLFIFFESDIAHP